MKKRLDTAEQAIYQVCKLSKNTSIDRQKHDIKVILMYIEYYMKNSNVHLIKLSGNSRKQRMSKYKIFSGHKRHELEESGSTAYLKNKIKSIFQHVDMELYNVK